MVKLEEPDKGQAWIVAIAACIIDTILSGLARMHGLLYVAVIETYGVSRQDATLPFTIRTSTRCVSGPIVGVLGQRYGIRTVTFLGGIVASIGVALCSIAPNVGWLAIFWGGVHGVGFAFADTLYQVVINQYFEKYRATASGIVLSGACVGSFVFPFMVEAILHTFGLSGGFLILGGFVMHVLPFSFLIKSPPWVEDPEKYARLKALKMKQESLERLDENVPDSPPKDNGEVRNLKKEKEKKFCKSNAVCTSYKITESPKFYKKNSSMMTLERTQTTPIPTISGDIEKKKSNINSSSPCEKSPNASSDQQASIWESIRGMGILFANPVFLLLNVCLITYIFIFIPIITVIVDYGKDKGISESYGKFLINAMAIGDLIGRLCLGWVTDRKFLTIPVFTALAFILAGVLISLFPLATDLYSFIVLLTLCGIITGAIVVRFPLLVLRYVDMNSQSVAMGSIDLLPGIVSLGISPLIGHFRDDVGSYDGMFYLMGCISAISGGFWLLEPFLLRMHPKKNKQSKILQDEKTKQEHLCEQYKSTGKITDMNVQKSS